MRRNLLLAAVTLILFFGLLEIALRLSHLVPTNQLRSPDLETLDRIPGMFEPGQQFVDRVLPELAYPVRINALGFRGADMAAPKPAGTVRVLCVGDSYTFGPYVTDEETFPSRLSARLKERAGAVATVEVINGGVSGFSIEDELIFVRDKAFAVQPDVIVLSFCQNDVLDMGRGRPMIETMRDHAGLKSTFLLGPALKILQHSALFNGMQRGAAMIKVMKMKAAPMTSDMATPQQWEAYHEGLARFVRTVRERGARLLVMVWISADQITGKATLTPQIKLAGFSREMGFELLDLAPAIRSLADGGVNPYFTPIDGHPNARGYEAAAEAAAARLIELGYLDPGVAPPAAPTASTSSAVPPAPGATR